MVKTVKALLIGSALLALAACDEFKEPKKQAAYESGEPVEVTRVFDCPVYAQRIYFQNENRNIFVSYCPQVKGINWTEKSGKTTVKRVWLNAAGDE